MLTPLHNIARPDHQADDAQAAVHARNHQRERLYRCFGIVLQLEARGVRSIRAHNATEKRVELLEAVWMDERAKSLATWNFLLPEYVEADSIEKAEAGDQVDLPDAILAALHNQIDAPLVCKDFRD